MGAEDGEATAAVIDKVDRWAGNDLVGAVDAQLPVFDAVAVDFLVLAAGRAEGGFAIGEKAEKNSSSALVLMM